MKKYLILFTSFYVLLAIFLTAESQTAIYKYLDKDGIVCFADDLQQIPEKYRATAVIVEGELDDETKPARPVTLEKAVDQTLPSDVATQNPAPWPLSIRLIISGCITLGVVLIFIVISKQAELKENKRILSLIRSSLIGIVSLYLLVAHVKDVMTAFRMAGKAIDEVKQQSAEKGKKAAQAIKTIDALFEEAQKAGSVSQDHSNK